MSRGRNSCWNCWAISPALKLSCPDKWWELRHIFVHTQTHINIHRFAACPWIRSHPAAPALHCAALHCTASGRAVCTRFSSTHGAGHKAVLDIRHLFWLGCSEDLLLSEWPTRRGTDSGKLFFSILFGPTEEILLFHSTLSVCLFYFLFSFFFFF